MKFQLVQCSRCALVYSDPAPSTDQVLEGSPGYQAIMQDILSEVRGTFVGRTGLEMLRRGRTPTGSPGRALDIGCSYGDYIDRLRSLGWDPTGIELDPAAAQAAREQKKLNVLTGSAEEKLAALASGNFNLVTMWHVLEHLSRPGEVLAEVHRVLSPGGKLVIEVPNFGSFWSGVLGADWFPLEYPYHRCHFTAETLRALLINAGFPNPEIRFQASPAETLWSLHMVWNRLRGRKWNGRLLWNSAAILPLYVSELFLALLGKSNHMQATAVKPA